MIHCLDEDGLISNFSQIVNIIPTDRIIRSSQSYIFPIHLSEEIIPAAIFYAAVTPLVAWFVVKKAIIEPMNAEQRKRDIDRIKETNKKRCDPKIIFSSKSSSEPFPFSFIQFRMAEKKREAEAAVDLMTVQYERCCSDEEKRNGLIISRAIYGKISDDSTTSSQTSEFEFTNN